MLSGVEAASCDSRHRYDGGVVGVALVEEVEEEASKDRRQNLVAQSCGARRLRLIN